MVSGGCLGTVYSGIPKIGATTTGAGGGGGGTTFGGGGGERNPVLLNTSAVVEGSRPLAS